MRLRLNCSSLKMTTWYREDETFMSTSTKQIIQKQTIASYRQLIILQNFIFSASSRLSKLIVINRCHTTRMRHCDSFESCLMTSRHYYFVQYHSNFQNLNTYIQNDFDKLKCQRITGSNHEISWFHRLHLISKHVSIICWYRICRTMKSFKCKTQTF